MYIIVYHVKIFLSVWSQNALSEYISKLLQNHVHCVLNDAQLSRFLKGLNCSGGRGGGGELLVLLCHTKLLISDTTKALMTITNVWTSNSLMHDVHAFSLSPL